VTLRGQQLQASRPPLDIGLLAGEARQRNADSTLLRTDQPSAFLTTFRGNSPQEFSNTGRYHNLNLQLSGIVRLDLPDAHRSRTQLIVPGQLSLNVAEELFECVVWPSSSILTLHVCIPPDWIRQIRDREFEGRSQRSAELHPELGMWSKPMQQAASRIADMLRFERAATSLELDELNYKLAMDLIGHLAGSGFSANAPKRLSAERLRTAVEFLHDHLSEDLRLIDLSSAVGLSPFHFSRSFKASVGVSPHKYLSAIRIERSKAMLAVSRMPITQIAMALGFDSASHFSTAFRLATDRSPSSFRQQFAERVR
jgi:AraC family transcriptional regulator